jgi:Zn finger protein HypA/HybF involved in hydrogenase expression
VPKVHIVEYKCEQCGATETSETGIRSDGMCAKCGSPMKIEDLFSDRRFASLPVDEERRDEAA